jgi:hypothetical protein
MNYSLLGADRGTHLKIAMIAVTAVVVVVVAVGITAHVSDTGTAARARIDDIVVKAGKPAMYTNRDTSTVR